MGGLNLEALARTVPAPLADAHPRTWELLRLENLYRLDAEREALFTAAMRESCAWHYEHNSEYAAFCRRHCFDPEDLRMPADLERIPALSAEVFKHFDLATPSGPTLLELASSGTGGRPTRVSLDVETVLRMWAMGRATAAAEGIVTDVPARYVVFSPPPEASPGHGNPVFFTTLTEFAPAAEIHYAVRAERGGRLCLDLAALREALARFAASSEPTRLIGLPALIATAARALAADGIALGTNALVLTGAGWKNAGDAVGKDELRALLESTWGIPPIRVRDLYGMTEHPVHYLECCEHRFHAPVFSRVRIVDPLSRRRVADGDEGVVHLMSPAFTTMPFASLLTSDVGRRVDGCPCGRGTPAFEVHGRGGRARHRGCAATTLGRLQ